MAACGFWSGVDGNCGARICWLPTDTNNTYWIACMLVTVIATPRISIGIRVRDRKLGRPCLLCQII